MKAVILAGGLGTRLSEETDLKPKPMLEIGQKPILWHIMKIYSAHGVNDFIICCGYKGYVIKEYFANYFLHMSDVSFCMRSNKMQVHQNKAEPWTVTLVDTGAKTLTGGRLKRVKEYVQNEESFCFTYGDGVGDINISSLLKYHKSHGKLATLTATRPPGRYGALKIAAEGTVECFQEKPDGDGSWINGGFFVLSPKVIDRISSDQMSWEEEPLSGLAADGQLAAFKHDGFWQPMDTLREKKMLNDYWDRGASTLESLVIEPAFWKNCRVFLTGHTGFKGSWLSLWLHQLGAVVTGFSLHPPTDPSLFEDANVVASLEQSVYGDIRDGKALASAMQDARPEVVIHMAAQPLVRESYIDPVETYATNVMGTVNVLEASRNTSSVKAILNITTDKCYENREWVWGYRENEPMGGHDPYSSSKGCAELVSSAYRSSFLLQAGIALATARAGNVIGGGDWAADRIVPDAMRAFMNRKCLEVRNPLATRPWQHVLEPLTGYLMLCQQLVERPNEFSVAWNFGPGSADAKPVSQLVDIMIQSWGDEARWKLDTEAHPHEANYLKLDCSKAKSNLKWQPIWNLNRALSETVQWYKARHTGEDMNAFTLQQIAGYQKELEGL